MTTPVRQAAAATTGSNSSIHIHTHQKSGWVSVKLILIDG
jgi:hypothetical protein